MVPLLLVLLPPIADADDAEGISVEEEEVLPDEDATVPFRFIFAEGLAAALLAGGFLSRLVGGAGGIAAGVAAAAVPAFCCC